MPGNKLASIKRPDVYEALRKKGYSKEKAARIANSRDSTIVDALWDAFETTREVPREVKAMPAELQKVWTMAFTKALNERPEDLAGDLAMATIKKLFKQKGDTWVSKGKGDPLGDPSDPESEEYDPRADPESDEYDPDFEPEEEEPEIDPETGEEIDPEIDPETGEEIEPDEEDLDLEGEEDPDAELEGGEDTPVEEEFDPAMEAEGEATMAEETAAMARAKAKYRNKVKAKLMQAGDSLQITELMTFDAMGFRITDDGFLVTEPRVARTGIQIYRGWEVGRPDLPEVRVYRPESEVFDTKAMASLAHRTITLEHPNTAVDSSNWKKLTVGHSSEPVARDGDFIRVPLVLMDANAVEAAQSGKSQLSVGYGAKLVWQSGQAPDGQLYDARQTEIRANHIALVSAARGGKQLKIGDGRRTHGSNNRRLKMERTMNLDGVSIELDEKDAQIVQRHLDAIAHKAKDQNAEVDALKAQIAELQAKLAEAMKRAGTTDGEIAALKQTVADSALTPEKLDKALNLRMEVVDRATGFFGDAAKYQWMGKADQQIRRDVVTARLGDQKAKTMNDDAIEGAFLSITEPETQDGFSRMTQSFSRAPAMQHNDRAAMAYDKRNEDLANRFKKNRKPFNGASA